VRNTIAKIAPSSGAILGVNAAGVVPKGIAYHGKYLGVTNQVSRPEAQDAYQDCALAASLVCTP